MGLMNATKCGPEVAQELQQKKKGKKKKDEKKRKKKRGKKMKKRKNSVLTKVCYKHYNDVRELNAWNNE